jgi:hypothetical protein
MSFQFGGSLLPNCVGHYLGSTRSRLPSALAHRGSTSLCAAPLGFRWLAGIGDAAAHGTTMTAIIRLHLEAVASSGENPIADDPLLAYSQRTVGQERGHPYAWSARLYRASRCAGGRGFANAVVSAARNREPGDDLHKALEAIVKRCTDSRCRAIQ